jgi:hypothetical protein
MCYIFSTCSNAYGKLDNLEFKLGDYNFYIRPETYMVEFSSQG